MPNTPISFNKGSLANLPNTKTAGALYFVTDERAIYLDVSSSSRIRFGDFQEFATVADLEAYSNPSTSALYYVVDINCLAKWNGTSYVQINLDTGATSIEITGSGNAITTATYNATTRKITFTKGATYMTSSDVDNKITNLDLADTYYNKALGEATATAVSEIRDGTTIDSFSDVEAALEEKQDVIPDNTYDDYGSAAAVLGSNSDAAGANTVYGANKAAAAAQATADAKVASVTAGDDSVTIGGTATAPTVAVKIDSTSGNNIQLIAGKGLRVEVPSAAEYTITKQAAAESGFLATYQLFRNATAVGDKINIPKDFLVKSASVNEVTTADTPYSGAAVGDKYIDFVINVKEGTAADEHIYLPVNDLVDVYTGGNGINISSSNTIAVQINNGNANGLAVDSSGLKLAVATNSNAGAMSAADHAMLHEHANKALLDTYTQSETDLADAVSKKHTHTNKTVLDGITSTKVSNWDGEVGAMSAITAIKDGTTLDSFSDVESALANKQDDLTFDSTPTSGSSNPVTSGGVYAALQNVVLAWGDF